MDWAIEEAHRVIRIEKGNEFHGAFNLYFKEPIRKHDSRFYTDT